MPINPLRSLPMSISSFNYSLDIQLNKDVTHILMKLNYDVVNTKAFPRTVSLLKQHIPSVLESKCFNYDNIPFSEEVKRTEIGHLFEHILLEQLCLLKVDQGYKQVSFKGVTSWNWVEEARGTFHIELDAGFAEADIFQQAIAATIEIVDQIYQPHVLNTSVPTSQLSA